MTPGEEHEAGQDGMPYGPAGLYGVYIGNLFHLILPLLVADNQGGGAEEGPSGQGGVVLRHRGGVERRKCPAVCEVHRSAGHQDALSVPETDTESVVVGFNQPATEGCRVALDGNRKSGLNRRITDKRPVDGGFEARAVNLAGDDVASEVDVDDVVAVDGALGRVDEGAVDVDGGSVAFCGGPGVAGEEQRGHPGQSEAQAPEEVHHDAASPVSAATVPAGTSCVLNGAMVLACAGAGTISGLPALHTKPEQENGRSRWEP